MANSVVQTIRDAEIDARSLSEFIYSPADAMIARRLAPSIHSLQYYLDFLDTIPSIVQNAIDNTVIENGVVTDSLVVVDGSTTQAKINKGLESIADLSTINNPKDGLRVYVKHPTSMHYTYSSQLQEDINGVTVVGAGTGAWVMDDAPAYYATWFAVPDIIEDQCPKLQIGLDYATSKGKDFIVDGVFHIECNVSYRQQTGVGLIIRDNSVIRFEPQGELHLISQNQTKYFMMIATNVHNYKVYDARLFGDRLVSKATGGEWGMGIACYGGSNGYISRMFIKDMWGDGIVIANGKEEDSNKAPYNMVFEDCVIEGVRRNGISAVAWDTLKIIRPIISKVGDYDGVTGVWPKSCIDFELEGSTGIGVDAVVDSAILKDSYAGVYLYLNRDGANVTIHFQGVTVLDGINNTPVGLFYGNSGGKGYIHVDTFLYKTKAFIGMSLGWNAASDIKVKINNIVHRVGNFLLRSSTNGLFTEKLVGNVTIDNIDLLPEHRVVFRPHEENTGIVIDNYQFYTGNSYDRPPITLSDTVGYTGQYTKNTVLDGGEYHVHKGFSGSTKSQPNNFWINPDLNGTGSPAIYMNSSGDWRRLKIGLWVETVVVGGGCRIQGITIDGVKKVAVCTTKGGWLDFRNIENGNTVIYGKYGDWSFQ